MIGKLTYLLPVLCLVSAGAPRADEPLTPDSARTESRANGLVGPLAPNEALKAFQLPEDLTIELVAAEPLVVDPIALAFDADGRLFVVEMRDYPLGPGEGKPPLSRIKLLEDTDGDGRMDRSSVFAEGLSFAMGVAPWDGGVMVMCPPEILFFKDTDGDGRADVRRVLFDGFATGNPQHRPNLLDWGLDNWVYVCGARSSGTVRSHVNPDAEPVEIRGSDFRFDPHRGVLESVAGWTQFGMGHDDAGHRFTQSNSDHIRHVVLPARYLERNPYLTLTEPMARISDHGQAGEVYQISRPQQRFNDFSRVGHFTSCCGITVFRGDALGAKWYGAVLTAEPVANLVHCDFLSQAGPTFSARRAEEGKEFLASTDNWFRPVNFATGPDGALYVVDMYRQHIEHPEWIPLSTQRKINLRAGEDQGRIYRVRRKSSAQRAGATSSSSSSAGGATAGLSSSAGSDSGSTNLRTPHLATASTEKLVASLSNPNGWVRDTAQRLLVERQDTTAVPMLEKVAEDGELPQTRLQALWALEGLAHLRPNVVKRALEDPDPAVRENALRLSEETHDPTASLSSAVLSQADDPDPRVRFQLALTAGGLESAGATQVLAKLARRDADDSWQRAAILTAGGHREPELLAALVNGSEPAGGPQLVRELAAVVGSRRDAAEVSELISRVDRSPRERESWWQVAALDGLADGLDNRRGEAIALGEAQESLVHLLTAASTEQVRAARRLAAGVTLPDSPAVEHLLAEAREQAAEADLETSARVEAIRFAAQGPFEKSEPVLTALMEAQQPPEAQTAAALSLLGADFDRALPLVLARWSGLSPPVRSAIIDYALTARSRREGLLSAIEAGRILPAELSLSQRTALLTDSDAAIGSRAKTVLAEVENPDRAKVVEENLGVLSLPADGARGWQVFRENCGSCHQLENAGRPVGPDLTTVRNHPKRVLLEHILNPSHVIEPNYVTYVVETVDGRVLSGMIRSETAQALTLVGSDGKEQTILRPDVEAITSTGKSLMPEGLEHSISQQGLADLIAFLRGE